MKRTDQQILREQSFARSTGLNVHQRIDIPLYQKHHVAWVAHHLERASQNLFAIAEDNKHPTEVVLKGKLVLEQLRYNLKHKIDYKKARYITKNIDTR